MSEDVSQMILMMLADVSYIFSIIRIPFSQFRNIKRQRLYLFIYFMMTFRWFLEISN